MSAGAKTYTAADMRDAYVRGAYMGARTLTEIEAEALKLYPDPKTPRVVTVGECQYRVSAGILEYSSKTSLNWFAVGAVSPCCIAVLADLLAHPYEESKS